MIRIERELSGFRVKLGDGSHAMTHRVISAVGITHFCVLSTALTHLPAELLTHSPAHTDMERFSWRDVRSSGPVREPSIWPFSSRMRGPTFLWSLGSR